MGTKFCVNCKYYLKQGEQWFEQYCTKHLRDQESVDPVTGEGGEAYVEIDDLGAPEYYVDPYPFCRNVNQNGRCKAFVERVK